MNHAKSFRDVEVYTLARQLAKEVFETSKAFPKWVASFCNDEVVELIVDLESTGR
jgi:hypothetical protein